MKQVSLQVLNVVMLLQEACNGVQEFSHQEIQRMIGILRTNGMKLEPHGIGMNDDGISLKMMNQFTLSTGCLSHFI